MGEMTACQQQQLGPGQWHAVVELRAGQDEADDKLGHHSRDMSSLSAALQHTFTAAILATTLSSPRHQAGWTDKQQTLGLRTELRCSCSQPSMRQFEW